MNRPDPPPPHDRDAGVGALPGHGGHGAAPAPLDRTRIPVRIDEAVAAGAIGLICLISFANVVVRYLTNASFAFTEEISVFLLVVLTLMGAAAAFARDRNIRVTFFIDMTRPAIRRSAEVFGLLLTAVLFLMVAWYGWRFVADDWKYGTTSPGLGLPQWVYSVWLPVLAIAIVGRSVGRVIRLVRSARGTDGTDGTGGGATR
jgi:TRAP-type transport system small permease protein